MKENSIKKSILLSSVVAILFLTSNLTFATSEQKIFTKDTSNSDQATGTVTVDPSSAASRQTTVKSSSGVTHADDTTITVGGAGDTSQ